jgi:hypothetical protein
MNSHREFCEVNGFTLKKYLEKFKDLSFGEVVNKLMYDISKGYVGRKRYMYDKDLYGVSEQWAPPIDTWYLRKMDCENSTNELMALFEAAGLVGELRSFYWNVVGNSPVGGHSTLYAWDFKNLVWRHIETTVTKISYMSFDSFPTNDDTNDRSRITDVWFSFNSDVARHTFKTDAAADTYKKRDKFNNITIK